MCYKCLLDAGCCRLHLDDTVDLDSVASLYVKARLSECDRVQQALHESLQSIADAKIAEATRDIQRGMEQLRQKGDGIIDAERACVRDSLNQVQTRVLQALPLMQDAGAFVQEMCAGGQPWFSLDVNTDFFTIVRRDVAAPASLLLSVLQPPQPQPDVPSIQIMVILHTGKGKRSCFSLSVCRSHTFAHLKAEIEQETGYAQNRLFLQPWFCHMNFSDEDEIGNMIRDGWGPGDYKMHVFLDSPSNGSFH